MKKTVLMTGLLLPLFITADAYAADFVLEDPAEAAGYYHSDEGEFLLLANGAAYSLNQDGRELLEGPFTYSVLSDGENFIILDKSEDKAACLAAQNKNGKPEEGECYALYTACAESTGETDPEEGRQVQFGSYIFENDCEIYVRESLAVFFGIDGSGSESAAEKIEGEGFTTPEGAVEGYKRAAGS